MFIYEFNLVEYLMKNNFTNILEYIVNNVDNELLLKLQKFYQFVE